jgi:hypothetical protein
VKFTLDGDDNEDNLQNENMPFPFPDAVEEFSADRRWPAGSPRAAPPRSTL